MPHCTLSTKISQHQIQRLTVSVQAGFSGIHTRENEYVLLVSAVTAHPCVRLSEANHRCAVRLLASMQLL